jgi:hypothetical protein
LAPSAPVAVIADAPSVMRTLNAWSGSLTFHLVFVAAVTRNVLVTLLTSQH